MPEGRCMTGATQMEVPFYKSIVVDFMVYQDRIETNLLQLVAHLETFRMVFYNCWYYF